MTTGEDDNRPKAATTTAAAASPLQIPERYHSEPHFARVIHVGAGAAGLLAAYKTERMLRNYELVVYEKNDTVGGTWLENRYPGCACDIPSHIYNFSFEPNAEWSSFYARGGEIQEYFVRFYEKYQLQKYMRFGTTVVGATWHDARGQWEVQLEKDGDRFSDWCHVLINGSGVVNKWKYPAIPGIDEYKGTLTHSAHWDPSIRWEDKTVAVIGSGASAVQLLPQLVNGSKSTVCFARNPTWVVPNVVSADKVHPVGMPPAAAGKHHFVEEKQVLRSNPHLCTKKSCPIRASPRSKRLFTLSMAGRGGQIHDSLAVVIPR
ncbi:monooxygenase [Aspergillus sp. HF37]|nr:monooxygenase [Aspergillus sp. HF37]